MVISCLAGVITRLYTKIVFRYRITSDGVENSCCVDVRGGAFLYTNYRDLL